jgi:hypothetical protein
VKVTEVPSQTAPAGVALMDTLTGKMGLTSITIWLEVAGFPEVHVSEEETTQVTISLSLSVLLEKVEFCGPETSIPLIFHWKAGVVPALTAVAVKLTEVPEQIGPAGETVLETLTGSSRLTVTCLSAVTEAQGPDVIRVNTASP